MAWLLLHLVVLALLLHLHVAESLSHVLLARLPNVPMRSMGMCKKKKILTTEDSNTIRF